MNTPEKSLPELPASELLASVEEMRRDALEVFNLPETTQDVRDAIEYFASGMTVYIEKRIANLRAAEAKSLPVPSDALAILSTFAHEILMGAIRPWDFEDAAHRALSHAGLLKLEDVVALTSSPGAPQSTPAEAGVSTTPGEPKCPDA